MAFNGDETEAVGEAHKPNSYFEAFDGIVAALDALAKAVTPDDGDDGTPPEEGARPCCNSYFASFRNITDALERLKSAVEERIAAGGGIDEESDPVFRKWRDEGYSIGLGKGANVTSNGVAIGWNSSAGSGTGFYIVKGFFDTVPKSLSEAAILDGCNQWQVFTKVVLPLSKPIVVYTVLTSFLAPWLDFVFVRVIVGPKQKYWTVALGLYYMLEKEYIQQWYTSWAAAAVIVSIPIAALFLAMQKNYVDGMTGAVKG